MTQPRGPGPQEYSWRIPSQVVGRPRGRPIRTTLWFGANGIINGNAVDMETNTEIEIHYDRWSTPSQPQVQRQAPAPEGDGRRSIGVYPVGWMRRRDTSR